MIVIEYLLILPFNLLVKALGWIFAPVIALFVDERGSLPRWLKWFQTPDSDMFGCYGDKGFCERHKDNTGTFWGRWKVCTLWQWRNTAQGFSTYCCGCDDSGCFFKETWREEKAGLTSYLLLAYRGGGKVVGFDLKGSLRWFNTGYRFRYRIGWKLRQFPSLPAQYVFSISPCVHV